ncbi:glycosyltransferase involved in cell wall biosynthesis [Dysgonomonadaceae bacterium PH5-43]|nr:glycosyltransferase involved in cell wall biosynthesis [Dysgonomonadaceae bacterium PH5-43]
MDYILYLKRIVKRINNVKFLGFQDPMPFYQSASVLCMTSNYEGWGMVLTESMQFGVVPIAFNSSGAFIDIINNEKNGILISPFNMAQYKKQLCNLLDNNSLRLEMSMNAQEDIKKYSVKNIVDSWEIILK